MKYLLTAVLATATLAAVSCRSEEKTFEVADTQTVELAVSGMT